MSMRTIPCLGISLVLLATGCTKQTTVEEGNGADPSAGGAASAPEGEPVEEPAGMGGADAPEEPEQSPLADPIEELKAFIAAEGIDFEAGTSRLSLPKPPQLEFPAGRNYYWILETNFGDMKIRLMPDVAPMHVSSTAFLTLAGFYDGLVFHRIIPGFMAQGGCPLGNGMGSPGYGYGSEIDPMVRHGRAGLLSMANTGQPNSDGSQFFLTFQPTPHLDGKHTIFGEVVAGMETLRELEKRGTRSGATTERVTLKKATILVE